MDTNEKELNPEKSIRIIESMIQRTKSNLHDSSFYFLLWGWIVLIGILGHTFLVHFTNFTKPYLVWLIIILGLLINIIYGMRQGKKKRISTHVDKINFMTWIAFLVSYTITLIFMAKLNYNIVPIIFLLAGNATFLTGIIIKFRPLIWGGIIFWIGAIGLFTLPGNLSIFIPPLAIIFGYLIPGYILKSQNKNNA